MTDKKCLVCPYIYCCIVCGFNTHHKRDYNKHLLTAKHIKLSLILTNTDTKNQIVPKASCAKKYECKCGKNYSQRQSLFTHKKKCAFLQKEVIEDSPIVVDFTKLDINTHVILDIIKENQEFKNLLIDQQRQVMDLQKENNLLINRMVEISQHNQFIPTTVNNNTTNNQFNLNIFLNETCKNAINFTEFIDNIQVSDNDLENNARMGFVDGVTKIILDNLKQLELTNRPIHCTDIKRETIYVKEEDQWDKDTSKETIQRGIQEITRKNMCKLSEWREDNPEYDNLETEMGEKSIAIQQHSMAGRKRDEFYPKIIKNIAKEAILNKNKMLE